MRPQACCSVDLVKWAFHAKNPRWVKAGNHQNHVACPVHQYLWPCSKKRKVAKKGRRPKYIFGNPYLRFRACSKKNASKESSQINSDSSSRQPATMVATENNTSTSATTVATIADSGLEDKIGIVIYFCVDGREWYHIDPCESTKQRRRELTSEYSMPDHIHSNFGAVALGSKLYAIGGRVETPADSIESLAQVFVYDTQSTNSYWEKGPSMISAKQQPYVSAIEGKIYAMGTEGDDAVKGPWAEFFDMESNEWVGLPPPHVKSSSWLRVEFYGKDIMNDLSARHVAVDDMLFSFSMGQLYACDLTRPRLEPEPVSGLERLQSVIDPGGLQIVYILHIGKGELCLIWTRETFDDTIVHCLKFLVDTDNAARGFRAVIIRSDTFIIDGDEITNCTAMFKLGTKRLGNPPMESWLIYFNEWQLFTNKVSHSLAMGSRLVKGEREYGTRRTNTNDAVSSNYFYQQQKHLIKMASGALGGIRDSEECSQNSVEIESLTKFAVDKHNKKENALLEFARVVKAKEQVVSGTMHHLTLEAIDVGKKKIYKTIPKNSSKKQYTKLYQKHFVIKNELEIYIKQAH
ncbi:hypothetical protein IFM89_034540 [Coptis chinensis]|uniref:Cysteine proteinase inhibitor n=1 Tax=Coptis chinensis TaxID=261450 RepID=A0A835HS11_9MAGN|nr:hypothetical protein IFM89_034540 [Coptis chinensis]